MIFSIEALRNGIPALRHDWFWVADRAGFVATAMDALSGWSRAGLGAPQTHPTGYVLAGVLAFLGYAVGPLVALAVTVFGTSFFAACAGWRLGSRAGSGTALCIGSAAFATLNPWVYTKLVSGHIFLIVAYAASMMLASELLNRRQDRLIIAILAILSMQQLQFGLVAICAVMVWSILKRQALVAAIVGVAALPTVIGILSGYGTLNATPYNLAWQSIQSVNPIQAWTLRGYTANYTGGFPWITILALWGVVAFAAFGVIVATQRDRRWLVVPAGVLGAVLFAMGVNGPIAPLYRTLVLRLPESGVYRELYDVLGFVAIGYLLLASIAASKSRRLEWAWLVTACIASSAWIAAPPAFLWVNANTLPHTIIDGPRNSRFALMPPFQPLSYQGRGSGLDPSAYIHSENRAPINGEELVYPLDVALARYGATGDVAGLAGLSVSTVVEQSWLKMDQRAIREQLASPNQHWELSRAGSRPIKDYLPELSVSPIPNVSDIGNRVGFGEVLFADVAGLRGSDVPHTWANLGTLRSVSPSNVYLRASDGWVRAEQAFPSQPELGQGIGGAFTTSSSATLQLEGGRNTLMFVRGALLDRGGKMLVQSNGGYRWVTLPKFVQSVRCSGECAIAAQGDPPRVAAIQNRLPFKAIDFKMLAPWLVSAELPSAADAEMLRYNVRFDSWWFALLHGASLPHFRVDTTVNGWILPKHSAPERVYLINYAAMAECISEILGLGMVSFLFLRWILRLRRLFAPAFPYGLLKREGI